MSRLATALRRIRFVILRTAGSPPLAPHPASRRRSYLQLRSPRPAPARTSTVLTKRPHGRTHARESGHPGRPARCPPPWAAVKALGYAHIWCDILTHSSMGRFSPAALWVYQGTRWALGDVLWRWRWVGLGIVASKKGAALLERMVHAGSTCLRRVADEERRSEVRFNRFLANPKVTVERLVAGWSEATGAAVVGRHVLAIQDTSEINFRTTRTRTRGLGEIGKGVGRGALLHAMVAVDGESEACLGLVAGAVWTRCGRVGVPHGKRPLDQKESHRWIKTATAGKGVLEGAATVTMVADREADLYALWALVLEPGVH